MGKLPSGFKTREQYNEYMRDYRQRQRAVVEKLRRENSWLKQVLSVREVPVQVQELRDPNFPYDVNCHSRDK